MIKLFISLLLTLSVSSLAVVNAPSLTVTSVEYILCNDGNYWTIACPAAIGEPGGPPMADAITGWTNVTTALDATGSGTRIDVGGGNNDHADLSTLDPGTFTPGTVVNLFHRANPYTSKLAFVTDGTEADPIIINGVTDANGNRPEIDCDGATTVQSQDWSIYLDDLGCWTLAYSRDGGTYNDKTEWYTFQNLEMYGANSSNTYDGGLPYTQGTSTIRLQDAAHIVFQGNIFTDNDNGLFVSSANVAEHIQIRGNYFNNNGVVGSFLEHGLYLQAVSTDPVNWPNVVEGNYFGPLRSGALGLSGVKQRGTDLHIRYNTIVCFQRCIDIVEAQDELPDWIYTNFTAQQIIDRYRTSYIYGNQIIIDTPSGYFSTYPIHVGMDTGQVFPNDDQVFDANAGSAVGNPMARGYQSPVYFYHNSFYIDVGTEWRQALFDLDAGSSGASTYIGSAVASNNVWQVVGDVSATNHLIYLQQTGNLTLSGGNLLSMTNMAAGSPFEGVDQNDDPDITITGAATVTTDPLFTDVSNANIEFWNLTPQVGSPAIGAAGALPAGVPSVLLKPVPAHQGGGASTRSTTNDLGAFE
jgi:hypothetical protein